MEIPNEIKSKMKKLLDKGFECHIVGGAVRDSMMGIIPHDWDLFTNATGEQILEVFPSGKVLGGLERQEKILTVIVDDTEISSYRINGDRTDTGVDLKTHCGTCDFTINSMACNIFGVVIDHFEGLQDIQNRYIRAVGNPKDRIKEDSLRIIRGIRFANKYNFNISSATCKAMEDYKCLLLALANERIKDEIFKILPFGIRYLDEFVFSVICPQFTYLKLTDGGEHHDETPYEHSVLTYEAMRTLTDNSCLLMGALFHDIGKSITASLGDDGVTHFYQHEIEGYKFMKNWLREYKFAQHEIQYISGLIKLHMYDSTMSKSGYIKLFNQLEERGIPVEHLLFLRYADSQGNLKKNRYKFAEKSNGIVKMYYKLKFSKEPFRVVDLEVNGNDCIKLGYSGKIIGDLLNRLLYLIQEDSLTNDRPKLLAWLKKQPKPAK